jgi:hypothetical protein
MSTPQNLNTLLTYYQLSPVAVSDHVTMQGSGIGHPAWAANRRECPLAAGARLRAVPFPLMTRTGATITVVTRAPARARRRATAKGHRSGPAPVVRPWSSHACLGARRLRRCHIPWDHLGAGAHRVQVLGWALPARLHIHGPLRNAFCTGRGQGGHVRRLRRQVLAGRPRRHDARRHAALQPVPADLALVLLVAL